MPSDTSGREMVEDTVRETAQPLAAVPGGSHIRPSHICFAIAGVLIVILYLRRKRLGYANRSSKKVSGGKDLDWKIEDLRLGTMGVFLEIQSAWAEGDMVKLNRYLEKALFQEWETRRAGLKPENLIQTVTDVTIQESEIIDAKGFLDYTKDEFTAKLLFIATDKANPDGSPGRTGTRRFIEVWKMGRFQERFRVREISRDGAPVKLSLALESALHEDEGKASRG